MRLAAGGALLLLWRLLAAGALPADWFLEAADVWRRQGQKHPWFLPAVGHEPEHFASVKDPSLRSLLPEIFRLRFSFLALLAVPDAREARHQVLIAHRSAMAGAHGKVAVLQTPDVRAALNMSRGRELKANISDVPHLAKGERWQGKKALGLSVSCEEAQCQDEDVDEALGEEGEKLALAISGGGVRHLDMSGLPGGDAWLGDAWPASGVDRENLFLATSLRTDDTQDPDDIFEEQLEELDTDYVDALLLRVEKDEASSLFRWWKMQDLQEQNKIRALAVAGAADYALWRQRTEKGLLKRQPLLLHLEAPTCSVSAAKLHVNNTLSKIEEDQVEVVFHDAAVCHDEPVVALLARRKGTDAETVVAAWMKRTGAAALFKASADPEEVQEELAATVEMSREESALMWGLSLVYGVETCETKESCGTWCKDNDYFSSLRYDPLGMKELFFGTEAPCVGRRPQWAAVK